MAILPGIYAEIPAVEGFGPEAFDHLFTQLTFSSAVQRWGEAVFDTYEGQTSHTLMRHVDALIEVADISCASRVLELGSGTGGLGCYVARRTGCILRGIDWSEVAVRLANERASAKGLAKQVRFLRGDLRNLTLPNHTYDVVFAIDAIQFDTDLIRLSSNIARILCAGGRFAGLITVRADTGTNNDEALPGVPTVAEITSAFAFAGLPGKVYADLTSSYTALVERMLKRWKEDVPNLERELGTKFVEARISEDTLLLTLLYSGALRRVLFATYMA